MKKEFEFNKNIKSVSYLKTPEQLKEFKKKCQEELSDNIYDEIYVETTQGRLTFRMYYGGDNLYGDSYIVKDETIVENIQGVQTKIVNISEDNVDNILSKIKELIK